LRPDVGRRKRNQLDVEHAGKLAIKVKSPHLSAT
jgi:hypothetical protein